MRNNEYGPQEMHAYLLENWSLSALTCHIGNTQRGTYEVILQAQFDSYIGPLLMKNIKSRQTQNARSRKQKQLPSARNGKK